MFSKYIKNKCLQDKIRLFPRLEGSKTRTLSFYSKISV